MNRNRVLGILSLLLLVIAYGFSNNYNDLVLGQYIFYKLGLPIYSNGTTGLNYPVAFSFTLFILAIIGLNFYGKYIHPNYRRIILLVIIFGPFFYNMIYSNTYQLIKKNSTGLNAIGYDRRVSFLNYESTKDNKYIKIESSLTLKNYSDKPQYFNIKLIPDKSTFKEFISDHEIIAIENPDSPVPKEFYIEPKLNTSINATFYIKPKKGVFGVQGNYNDIDIVLFHGKDKKEFIKLVY